MERGYTVSAPLCGLAPYDRIVDASGVISKVQVKSVSGIQPMNKRSKAPNRGYLFKLRRQNAAYKVSEVDMFACYAAPEELWFLVPFNAVEGQSLWIPLAPKRDHKYSPYLENWSLLERI